MIFENIGLGKNVSIADGSTINNVEIKDNVKIAKNCSVYGSSSFILLIGKSSYIGMNCLINGYNAKVEIGENVSIAQNVTIISDSGPNASQLMQKYFPIEKGPIIIGSDSWIGAGAIIMPNVVIGKCCVIAANSFVNKSFGDYSVIGGTPAKVLKRIKS